jgi:tetratricopeptide (TPR) repeat protein
VCRAVLDALAGLVDKSVLIAERTGVRAGYRLPQTLREYGRSILSDSQDLALRRKHRDYYGRLGSLAWEEWFGPRQVQWTSWMRDEHVNLRAALEFCLADPAEVGAGFEMLPALGLYWSVSGSLGEGRRFLDQALSAKSDPSPGRAKALWVTSWVAVHQGDLSAAEHAAEESRRLGQRYSDERAFAHASVHLGMARMLRGDTDSAQRLFHEALATAGKANLVGTGAMRRLAEVARQRGDIHAANAGLREIVAICQAHGEYWEQASALWSLAILAWEQGDDDQATALSRESLALRAMFGDRVGIAQCLEVLAWAAAGGGAYDRAATMLGAADAVWKAVGASLFAYLARFHEDCESIVRRAPARPPRAQACTTPQLPSDHDRAIVREVNRHPSAVRRNWSS